MKKLLLLLTLYTLSTSIQPAGNGKKDDKKHKKNKKKVKTKKKNKDINPCCSESSLAEHGTPHEQTLKKTTLDHFPAQKIQRQIGTKETKGKNELLALEKSTNQPLVDVEPKNNTAPLITETRTPHTDPTSGRSLPYLPHAGVALTATVLIGCTLYYFNKPIIKGLSACKNYIAMRLYGN